MWRTTVWWETRRERLLFGTDTAGVVDLVNLDVGRESHRHDGRYEPTRRRQFRKALEALGIEDYRTWTFIDLGSGKGRVLLLAAAFPFRRIIGIEFSAELNALARANLAAYRGDLRSANIEVVHADAAIWQFPADKMIVYLFNPFGEEIMARVLDNIEVSLRVYPRRTYVIYMNPVWREVFDRSSLLKPLKSTEIWAVYQHP